MEQEKARRRRSVAFLKAHKTAVSSPICSPRLFRVSEVLCAFFEKRLKSCKWLFTPFQQNVTRVDERQGGPNVFQTSMCDATEKSFWEYRMQRFSDLEKIIHCWSDEIGLCFTEWFDSHDVIAGISPPDLEDPLCSKQVTSILRSCLGVNGKNDFFNTLFSMALFHTGSFRTIINVIAKELQKNKTLQRFLLMTVQNTFLGKYVHCRCRANLMTRRKLREQINDAAVNELIGAAQERPLILVCLKEYLFDKINSDSDFRDIFKRCATNFEQQFKFLTINTENLRLTLFKKIHEGHLFTHVILKDSSFAFLQKINKKLVPLHNNYFLRQKFIDAVLRDPENMTAQHKKCLATLRTDNVELTPEVLSQHFPKDVVLQSLKMFSNFKTTAQQENCLLSLVYADQIKVFTLPKALSVRQLSVLPADDMTFAHKTSIIFCPVCLDLKNMTLFQKKSEGCVFGYRNMKTFPMMNCVKCSFATENQWCDGGTLKVSLVNQEKRETFCFKFFEKCFLLSPCCGKIISVDAMSVVSEGYRCKYCIDVNVKDEKQTQKVLTEECHICTKLVRRYYKNKKDFFSSVGSKQLCLASEQNPEKQTYYFCKSHVRSWMHNSDTCPETIENVVKNIQQSSRLTKKRKKS